MIFALALALAVQEPVRVELNHDQYSAGDKARVYVRSAQDGSEGRDLESSDVRLLRDEAERWLAGATR